MSKLLVGHDPINNGSTNYYLLHDDGRTELLKIKDKMNNQETEKQDLASKEKIDALDEVTSIRVEIAQLIGRINKMNNTHRSREKSIVTTKLEEAGHWLKQDIEVNHRL